MAMSRLILKDLTSYTQISPYKTHTWSPQLLHRFSATMDQTEQPDTKEISVSDSTKKPKPISPRRHHLRSLWSWDNTNRNLLPLSGLVNAVMDETGNVNKLLENLLPSEDDVKITVEDGVLFIREEHKEEEEGQGSHDYDVFWSAATYGYYNTSVMLPKYAKVEDITGEMKDGVLHVIIQKDETKKNHIKEVNVS